MTCLSPGKKVEDKRPYGQNNQSYGGDDHIHKATIDRITHQQCHS